MRYGSMSAWRSDGAMIAEVRINTSSDLHQVAKHLRRDNRLSPWHRVVVMWDRATPIITDDELYRMWTYGRDNPLTVQSLQKMSTPIIKKSKKILFNALNSDTI